MQQIEKTCLECSGEGSIINHADRCHACLGKCYIQETKLLDIKIYPGMRDGQRIVFSAEGDEAPNMIPGDVIIVLCLQPHERFSLVGDHLVMRMNLNITEALCGFKRPVTLLDSRVLVVNNRPGEVIKPKSAKKVEGEGFPAWPKKGDLIIEFDVIFPESNFTTPEGFERIEKIFPRPNQENYNMQDEHVEAVELSTYEPKQYAANDHHTPDEEHLGCVSH